MLIGIKNDFYCNVASRKIRLIRTGRESSKFFREKGSKQYLSMDSLPFQYSSNPSFLVQVLIENMVGNLFPRGIPIPLTYTHVCVHTHTHTHTHISLLLFCSEISSKCHFVPDTVLEVGYKVEHASTGHSV